VSHRCHLRRAAAAESEALSQCKFGTGAFQDELKEIRQNLNLWQWMLRFVEDFSRVSFLSLILRARGRLRRFESRVARVLNNVTLWM
jgi:hypothetical protein